MSRPRALWAPVVALVLWVGVLAAPAAAAPPSAVYYAGNTSNRVFPFSIGADGSLSPITCPGSNCNAPSPAGEAVTPNGRFLYTAGFGGDISAFAVAADGSLSQIPCPGGCLVGGTVEQVAVTPDGRFLYAPFQFDPALNAGGVAVFAIGSDGSLSRVACPASDCVTASNERPLAPVVTPDGKFLYVAAPGSFAGGTDMVVIFRIASDGTLTPVPCPGAQCATGAGPRGGSLTPDGRYLYVNNDFGASVSPFAIGADGSLTPIPCP